MSQFKKYLSTHYVLLITVATYLLYLITLNPSVTLGDTPEFIAAAYEGGVPHPTGYPLFTLVGHLIGYLPIGTMAEKINSVSALFGALTVGVTASLIYAVSKSKIAALFGSTSLALAFSFWLYAIHAEVYTMHTFFIALMLLFSMLFHQTKK